jgi:DEAD/DEAH box helicase domain-containing protein
MYIAGDDALDQFLCRHPEDFLERPVEAAILDHESPLIFRSHLLCAAHEGPLSAADCDYLGPRWETHAEQMVSTGELRRRPALVSTNAPADGARRDRPVAGSYVPRRAGDYPAAAVSLRSASADTFAIVDVSSGELLGSTEAARAFTTVHDGAVYMHLGRSYEVRELDVARRRALVAPYGGDTYTQPKRLTDTDVVRLLDRRKRLADHAQVELVALELPPSTFTTQAMWFELDADELSDTVPLDALLGTLHATEHAQIAVLPLIAMCDRWDIGGLSTNYHAQTGRPTIFIYDAHPGGIGISRAAFARFEELCRDAARLIGECSCTDGCPSCVQSPKCGNLNEPLCKAGAQALLAQMVRSSASARPSGSARPGTSARSPVAPAARAAARERAAAT